MPSKSEEHPLGELCSLLVRGAAPNYVEQGGMLVLNQKCVRDQRILVDEARRTDTILRPVSPQKVLQPFDILVNSTGVGTLGRVAQVLSLPEATTVDSHVTIVRANPAKVFPHFLGYAVKNYQEEIEMLAEGSTGQTELGRERLATLLIPTRPGNEQRAIAYILGTLDDKIELNRGMNETLEAFVTAIFKSWFVDFDPVRAKVSGESPASICYRLRLTPDLLELFPNRFQDSELGEIPEGWSVGQVCDVVRVVGGSTPSTKNLEYWDGSYAWATPKDLAAISAPVLLKTERNITELGLKQISSGLLPAGTLLMSSRAPIGYLAISKVPVAVNQGFIALICEGPVSAYYMLNWCQFNMDRIKQYAGGTTFAEINKRSFRPITFLVPGSNLLNAYTTVAKPFYDLIAQHCQEINLLGDIRDLLLPRLISGELRLLSTDQ
ncbi:restriction endonuclease subunit S [Chloroflexota bacterium]